MKMSNFTKFSSMLIFAFMTYIIYEKLCDYLKPNIEHINTNYKETLLIYKVVALVFQKLTVSHVIIMLDMNLKWEEQLFLNIQDWFVRHWVTMTNCILETLILQVVQDYNK